MPDSPGSQYYLQKQLDTARELRQSWGQEKRGRGRGCGRGRGGRGGLLCSTSRTLSSSSPSSYITINGANNSAPGSGGFSLRDDAALAMSYRTTTIGSGSGVSGSGPRGSLFGSQSPSSTSRPQDVVTPRIDLEQQNNATKRVAAPEAGGDDELVKRAKTSDSPGSTAQRGLSYMPSTSPTNQDHEALCVGTGKILQATYQQPMMSLQADRLWESVQHLNYPCGEQEVHRDAWTGSPSAGVAAELTANSLSIRPPNATKVQQHSRSRRLSNSGDIEMANMPITSGDPFARLRARNGGLSESRWAMPHETATEEEEGAEYEDDGPMLNNRPQMVRFGASLIWHN